MSINGVMETRRFPVKISKCQIWDTGDEGQNRKHKNRKKKKKKSGSKKIRVGSNYRWLFCLFINFVALKTDSQELSILFEVLK